MGISNDELTRMESIVAGDYVPPPKDAFDLTADVLFGGIAGFHLPVQAFEVMPGLTLARTYTHLIAPFILAFAPPVKSSAPHPGPWAALNANGRTVFVEAKLEVGALQLGFNRLNTLWFLVALLRLRLALPLQMIAISDRAFQDVPRSTETANILPVELNLSQSMTEPQHRPSEADLIWVRDNIKRAAQLMKDPTFNRVVRTLDHAVSIQSPGAGIVIAWAAIETLIRPGSRQITDRLCRSLATHLYPPGSERDRAFNEIATSYAARGGAVHSAELPEAAEFHTAFRLARATIIQCIEDGRLPDIEELLSRWQSRT
jgi:hypothetical protein